jgi:hypothetical protein
MSRIYARHASVLSKSNLKTKIEAPLLTSLYTEKLSQREVCTRTSLYTEKFLHTEAVEMFWGSQVWNGYKDASF